MTDLHPDTLQQLIDWQPPIISSVISQGIFPVQGRLILYGQWKTWKSMTAMHTAFTIASGKPWFGFHTIPHSVLLFQLEVAKPLFRIRVMKYAKGNDCYPTNLWFLSHPYLKLDRGYGFSEMERVLSIFRPQVLIVDPVYKVLSGDISSSHDVQILLDNLDIWIDKYGLSIMLITHTRKPVFTSTGIEDRGEEELMGSSYFPNWADSIIGFRKTGPDDITMFFTSLRHAEEEIKPIKVHIVRKTLQFQVIK